ncbi:hypothetical protein [Dactylosporangium sp. NPDC005555]|uniref:hypothetical protein n=1 Tax=Dactylosporangium sp. NPDC005555 TaxID=3154889 RepID=UPI0033B58DE5
MAFAGELKHRFLAGQAVTRVTNRVIGISHRIIGFGLAPAALDLYCRPDFHDTSTWVEMAPELRLREISRQA